MRRSRPQQIEALIDAQGRRDRRCRRSIRPSLAPACKQVIWSGALCRHRRAAAGDDDSQRAAISDRQGAGRRGGAYIRDQAGRQGQGRAADARQPAVPGAALHRHARCAQGSMPGVTIVADISPNPVNKEGGYATMNTDPAGASRTSMSCSAPTRSCWARCRRCARRGKARPDQFLGGIDGEPEAVAEIKKGDGPYKASIACRSPVFGYAMGQHAADWLEGKSIPQAMDILPIALDARQHRAVRGRPGRSGRGVRRSGAARRLSQDVRQHLLRHARPVPQFSVVVGDALSAYSNQVVPGYWWALATS